MSENKSFYRKIVYVVLLAILLFPISYLGAPATVDDDGGKLALVRQEAELGQSNLGAIDPASETIRMATLGLRGIAVSMLWNKANDYKKTRRLDQFSGHSRATRQAATLFYLILEVSGVESGIQRVGRVG